MKIGYFEAPNKCAFQNEWKTENKVFESQFGAIYLLCDIFALIVVNCKDCLLSFFFLGRI